MNIGNALGDTGKVHDACDQNLGTLSMPTVQEHSKLAWEKARQKVYNQLWAGYTLIDTEKWAAERFCEELCEKGYTAKVKDRKSVV